MNEGIWMECDTDQLNTGKVVQSRSNKTGKVIWQINKGMKKECDTNQL